MTKEIRNLRASLGRRLIPRANQLIVLGYAVKTLESKETRASKKITVTHNSVFAAHRLQCRMTIHKIDIRHFVSAHPLQLHFVILSEIEESLEIFLIFG